MKNPSETLVNAQQLTARRGGRTVYVGLGLEVEPGELVVLKGANGSGKSTLLRQLAGLLPITEGRIELAGICTREDPVTARSTLHYIGHADGLKPALTLRENLSLYVTTVLGESVDEDAIDAAAAAFDLSQLLDQPAQLFSAGQRHRSSLARLPLGARKIWLLDEPTVGLDAKNRERLASLVREHLDTGGAAIIATHDPLGVDGATVSVDEFVAEPSDAQLDEDSWL